MVTRLSMWGWEFLQHLYVERLCSHPSDSQVEAMTSTVMIFGDGRLWEVIRFRYRTHLPRQKIQEM